MDALPDEKLCPRCGWRLREADLRNGRCPECGYESPHVAPDPPWHATPILSLSEPTRSGAVKLAEGAVLAFFIAWLLAPLIARFGCWVCLPPIGAWGLLVVLFGQRTKWAPGWWLVLALFHVIVLGLLVLSIGSVAALFGLGMALAKRPNRGPSTPLVLLTFGAVALLIGFWVWVWRSLLDWARGLIDRLG